MKVLGDSSDAAEKGKSGRKVQRVKRERERKTPNYATCILFVETTLSRRDARILKRRTIGRKKLSSTSASKRKGLKN